MNKKSIGLKSIVSALLLVLFIMIRCQHVQAAISQIFNDKFFQNPAELSLVNKLQLIAGDLYIAPDLQFIGTSYGKTGKVRSNVHDSLPFLLTSYRFTDQFVFGINMTPSSYGHISWPENSFVNRAATTTKLLYYRLGSQSSYEVTSKLAIGLGLNLEFNKILELNSVVRDLGNQINKVSARSFTADVGLFYKINRTNFLTVAVYSPVNRFAKGISSIENITVNNFSATMTQAAVAYIGLKHLLTNKWTTEEKIYWSGWSIQKNLIFFNSATGDLRVPTYWKDVWSLQLSARYAVTEKIALLGDLTYESNPAHANYNYIGYPLASAGFIGVGLDIALQRELSAQLAYGYGSFLPNAKINNTSSVGIMPFNVQAATLQLTYKL